MKKILFLAANPRGTSPLRLDQELRDIDEGLRRSSQRDQFSLEQRWAVRPRDILQAMLDIDPQVVHFSGHGIDNSTNSNSERLKENCLVTGDRKLSPVLETPEQEGLFFENDAGQAILINGAALSGLFELFSAQVQCVVLNGCYSEQQAKAISLHIPYVIGMRQAISDQAAIEFSVGFYKALGAGRSIEFAYKAGCNAVQMIGVPENLTPVLLQSPGGVTGIYPIQTGSSRHFRADTFKSGGFEVSGSESDRSDPGQAESDIPEPIQTYLSEFPTGSVPLYSPLYIDRLQNESRYYQSIRTPGCLLRIMAPDLMGKTSLMARILNYATQHQYKKIYLSLGDVEQRLLSDLDSFLRWFCERISSELGLEHDLEQSWNTKQLGCIPSCTDYFEKQVLSQINQPFILGIDELDRIFPYPDIASDFFGMLRTWYEKGRDHPLWRQLRMVLSYSTEDYSKFRINQSPFNVGQPLKLKELTPQQTQMLADRYQLGWGSKQVEQLMEMVGGHPYLLRLAMYYIKLQDLTLEQLLQEAPTEDGIYSDHLYRYWKALQKNPPLAAAVQEVMTASQPVYLDRSLSHQLRSMGLVQYVQPNNAVIPSCNLYRIYFGK